ncbi:hypothetical protein SKAU_G00131000 [Synaphobranchus kaupii]|uniref:Retrotransposon gag domain-containing protein n=1 Tax=Synaphobranchus kaupii TaxID=118154 RepID=A0A9Q1FQM0_SYNKA|nr:hypothetical protein SKAU_G00131000 [Synaphobranchus kaupii]
MSTSSLHSGPAVRSLKGIGGRSYHLHGILSAQPQRPESTSHIQYFAEEMKVFDQAESRGEAGRCLIALSQGMRSLANYTIKFCTLAVESGWKALAAFSWVSPIT